MKMPQLYINVGQTIGMATAAVTVVSYLFDIRGFRQDVNELVASLSGRR